MSDYVICLKLRVKTAKKDIENLGVKNAKNKNNEV